MKSQQHPGTLAGMPMGVVAMDDLTHVRGASWVIAWDDDAGCHVYLRDCDVVFGPAGIIHVGSGFTVEKDVVCRTIDGRGLLVMPGFVNIHAHPTSEPLLRGLSEERKSRQFGMSTLYEYIMLVGRAAKPPPLHEAARGKGRDPSHFHDDQARAAAASVAVYEMLKSGVTTYVDYSPMRPRWLEQVESFGIRACLAPQYRSAYWYTPNGHEVLYEWDAAMGERTFQEALEFLDGLKRHSGNRVTGMVAPGQVDTCTPELIRSSRDAALERGLPWQIHAAQSVVEFREMFRRHGKTPIGWLANLGVLGPELIIAHAIFCDHHSWLSWPDRKDLDLMVETGVSVAHCPNVFVRGGVTLEDFGTYRRRGVNLGIGTDTHPHNFVDELRWATVLCKVSARDVDATNVAEVFEAATVGGARALGRDDVGRISPGCKADLVMVDLSHPYMHPVRDPLRTMIFSGLERAIRDVYVDGRQVVRDGEVLTIDIEAAIAELDTGQERALPLVPARDWAGRTADEAFPLSLPLRSPAGESGRGP